MELLAQGQPTEDASCASGRPIAAKAELIAEPAFAAGAAAVDSADDAATGAAFAAGAAADDDDAAAGAADDDDADDAADAAQAASRVSAHVAGLPFAAELACNEALGTWLALA